MGRRGERGGMEGKSKALRLLLMYKCCLNFMHVELRNA